MTLRPAIPLLCAVVGCATAIPQSENAAPDAAVGHDASLTGPDAPASACAYSGSLAAWSFVGEPGTETSTAASSHAPGVTATAITRASSLTAAAGTGSINASSWATTAQADATKYYTLTLTPPAGCTLVVTSVAVDAKSSNTGPASASLATSVDAFAHHVAVSTSAPSTPSVAVTNASGALEIRIFGFAASGAGGTMRLQNTLTVTGTLE